MVKMLLDALVVLLPAEEEGVQLLPVPGPEGSVHRGGHVYHAVTLDI